MELERSLGQVTQKANAGNTNTLRWAATVLATVVGIVNFYYGNTYAGFYENLWYIMGGLYIFAGILLAANEMPHLVQPMIFGYALFLLALWAVSALTTGAGLDFVAFIDKALEALLVINVALLIRNSRATIHSRH